MQFFYCLNNLLRCVRRMKNMVAGDAKVDIANRTTDQLGACLLSSSMPMKCATFILTICKFLWFWKMIQILHESNAQLPIVRIEGVISCTNALERSSRSFNHSTSRNIICRSRSFISEVFNAATRENIMEFSFGINQSQSCSILKFAVAMQVFLTISIIAT